MPIQLSQLGIPEDEVHQFQPFIRLYSKGKVILEEGDESDPRIFLLRVGTVEVTKKVGEQQKVLSLIEAVNFFGEIAVVAQRARTATITAVSDPVVVYAFDNPNLPAMLANPRWGILLIRRLAESVDHMNGQFERQQLEIDRLTEANRQLQGQTDQLTAKHEQALLAIERQRAAAGAVLGLFLKLQQTAGDDPELRSQFVEAVPQLVALRARELKVEPAAPDLYGLADYLQRGALPEPLFEAATRRTPPKA
jgi:CRP-like cAMP-binding protein